MISGSRGCFFEPRWAFSWAWERISVGSSPLPLCQNHEQLAGSCLGSEAVPLQVSQSRPRSSQITDINKWLWQVYRVFLEDYPILK